MVFVRVVVAPAVAVFIVVMVVLVVMVMVMASAIAVLAVLMVMVLRLMLDGICDAECGEHTADNLLQGLVNLIQRRTEKDERHTRIELPRAAGHAVALDLDLAASGGNHGRLTVSPGAEALDMADDDAALLAPGVELLKLLPDGRDKCLRVARAKLETGGDDAGLVVRAGAHGYDCFLQFRHLIL